MSARRRGVLALVVGGLALFGLTPGLWGVVLALVAEFDLSRFARALSQVRVLKLILLIEYIRC